MEQGLSEDEKQHVLQLDALARLEHFVARAAADGRLWGLWDDGWAMFGDAEDRSFLPLWPAREYAELLRTDDWASFEPREISLDEFLEDLVPQLQEDGVLLCVFPTNDGGSLSGATPSPEQLAQALQHALVRA